MCVCLSLSLPPLSLAVCVCVCVCVCVLIRHCEFYDLVYKEMGIAEILHMTLYMKGHCGLLVP